MSESAPKQIVEIDAQRAQFTINTLAFRAVLLLIICLAVGLFGMTKVYPQLASSYLDQQTAGFVNRLAGDTKTSPVRLSAARPQGAAWVYMTDSKGTVPSSYKSLVPSGVTPVAGSRTMEFDGATYYESVASSDGSVFHVGWVVAPALSALGDMACPLPIGFVFAWIALSAVMFLPAVFFNISGPLRELEKISPKLLGLDVDERRQLLDQHGIPYELRFAYTAATNICAFYDKEKFERLTKEHALKKEKKALTQEKARLETAMQDQMYQSHRSISELSFKESEDSLLKLLDTELASATTVSQVAQRALDRLNEKYPTSLRQMAVMYINAKGRMEPDYHIGLTEEALRVLKSSQIEELAHAAFSRGTAILLTEAEQEQFKMRDLCRAQGWQSFYLAPLLDNGRQLGTLIVACDDQTRDSLNDRRRVLQNVCQHVSRTVHKLVVLQEELLSARTDALTGLYNKKFFEDIMPKLVSRAKTLGHEISLLMIDGDHFKEINDTYGHQAGDQMLQELARLMKLGVRSEEQEKAGRFKDYVIRWGGEEFLIILDACDKETATRVADRLRKTVADKKDWPAGIAKWTISIGLSGFPEDADNVAELTKHADIALYYCKKELGRNKVARFDTVPKQFRTQMGGALQGELGVFDPVAILQSLATTQKSGILTVSSKDSKHFWVQWYQGKPVQARLGSLAGGNAIVEFITTFEEGKFNFQEKPDATFKKMLDESFDVARPLERCLMDAALAQDNLNWAKAIITEPGQPLHLLPAEQLATARAEMEADKNVTPEDLEIVNTVVGSLEYGDATMSELSTNLSHLPSAIVWRAAALMLRYGLVQIKQLATA